MKKFVVTGLILLGVWGTDPTGLAGVTIAANDTASEPSVTPAIAFKDDVFTSLEGGFSITLPPGFSAPLRDEMPSSSENGYTSSVNYYFDHPSKSACFLSYADLTLYSNLTTTVILDSLMQGGLENVNGTLDQQLDSMLSDTYPVRSVFYTAKDEFDTSYYARMDIVLAMPRNYFIGYYTYNKDERQTPAVENFFKSFQLVTP
jgi:hypothetical protein